MKVVKMRCHSLAIGAAVLAVATSIDPVGAQALDCRNATSQTAMTICAGQALKQSDAALNQTYSIVMARLSADGKAALRDAQRAWLAYRDKECFFEANGKDGGSSGSMVATNCAQALTDRRTTDLAQFRTCREGDLSCPR